MFREVLDDAVEVVWLVQEASLDLFCLNGGLHTLALNFLLHVPIV